MIGLKQLRLTYFLLTIVALASCTGVDNGQRCSLPGGCPELTTNQNAANLALNCTATPESSTVQTGELFDVTITASGGSGAYWIASGNGARRFTSSTVVSGGYKRGNTGVKREAPTIYDESGLSATCPFEVRVEENNSGCSITTENDNYTPAVDQELRFIFAANASSNAVLTYEFLPDDFSSNVGYILTKRGNTAAFDYAYPTKGVKRPTLIVSGSGHFEVCEISQLPVREPDFLIKGKRFAKLGDEDTIELEMQDNGEFSGTITYDYTPIDSNSTVTINSNLNEVEIVSTTTEYLKVRLKITATSANGDEVEKEVEVEFIPTTECTVATAGDVDSVIRGDKVSYTVSAVNNEDVVIHNVFRPQGARIVSERNDDGTYQSPVEIRFRKLGDRKVAFAAKTASNERCEDSNGNTPSYTVEVKPPVRCTAVAKPWRQTTNEPVDVEVRVPNNAGIGPYSIHSIVASSGSGFSEVTNDPTNKRQFAANEVGRQIVKFSSGRPGHGVTYGIDVEVKDEGDPEGRRFTCHTTLTSVMSEEDIACTAHFERDGTVVTQARSRDELDLVINANFTNYAEYYNYGSEVAPQGNLGRHPVPFTSHVRYNRTSNTSHRSSDTEVGVWNGGNIVRRCTANLDITGSALGCSIQFPHLSMSSAGVANNTILIKSVAEFPGNITADPLGKKLVTFPTTINNAVGTVTSRFKDRTGATRTFTETRPVTDGIYNTNMDLVGEYTRHGQYKKVLNRVTDSYDSVGDRCEANKFMYAHLLRRAIVKDADGGANLSSTKVWCYIKATNISDINPPATDHPNYNPNAANRADATLWLFGGAYGTSNWVNKDCHNLQSEHKYKANHNGRTEDQVRNFKFEDVTGQENRTTYCIRRYRPVNGQCDLAGKALGYHGNYPNPGDWRIDVWARHDDTGIVNGNDDGVYHLPNICQLGSNCQN